MIGLMTRFLRLVARIKHHYFRPAYLFNPWRRQHPTQPRWLRLLLLPIVRLGLLAGFENIDYGRVNGLPSKLHIGDGCSTMNTVFVTTFGEITVGRDTLFAHDCHVITGTHRFYEGRRASLVPDAPFDETEIPEGNHDVVIGEGCFIGAGTIILAPAVIGDNVIISAGSVVSRDIPSGSFAGGSPARVLGKS
jgi:acetyltransferase-like isoleucine patch superfamily enzyme